MRRICPVCKVRINPEEDSLYVEQKYETSMKGTMNIETGKVDMDIDAGYSRLDEFINNMLIEKGKPKIIGCDNCID